MRQEIVDRFKVRARTFPLHRKNRLDLGGKEQPEPSVASLDTVVQRLNPETISRQQESLVLLAPQSEGEHAAKAIEEPHPPPGKPGNRPFPFGTRPKGVAATFNLVP